MNQLQTSTLSDQNIATALLVATYTATACRGLVISVSLDQIAGNGNYQAYITRQLAGAGAAYQSVITNEAVPSGVTNHLFNSMEIAVDNTDVVKVYILGLAGDTTTPDIITRFYEHDYLRPTVSGRTLDVTSAGQVLTSASSIDTQLTSTHGAGNWTSGSAPSVIDIRTEMDTNSTKLANLDTTISSRFSGSSFIGPVSASSIDAQLISTHGSGAWTSGSSPSAVDIRTEMDNNSTKLANLDTTISSRLPSGSYVAPINVSASSIDAQLISTHGSGAWTSGSAPSVVQIRQEMDSNSAKLANLDVTISSRMSGSSYTVSPTVAQIDTQLSGTHGSGSWGSGSSFTPSVIDIRTEMDNNSTKLAKLDATISSRMSGSSYSVAPTVGQIDTQLTSTHGSGNWNGSGGGGGSSAADIWSYASRTLTQAIDGSTSSIVSGSSITFYSYATNYATVTSVPDDDEIWFTVKKNIMQPDSESIVQISKTGGLLYINGGIPASSSDGSLIVVGGVANIILNAEASPLAFGNSVMFTGEIKTKTSGSVIAVITQFPVIVRPLITKTI